MWDVAHWYDATILAMKMSILNPRPPGYWVYLLVSVSYLDLMQGCSANWPLPVNREESFHWLLALLLATYFPQRCSAPFLLKGWSTPDRVHWGIVLSRD